MKDELEKLQNMLSAKEARGFDLENKLIQERLKSDQIRRDLARSEETAKDTKTDLNEQISKNHNLIKMLDTREKEFVELNKKYRECKKNLQKAETQLNQLQNQLQDELTQRSKLEQHLVSEPKTESTKSIETDRSKLVWYDYLSLSWYLPGLKFGDDEGAVYSSSEVHGLRDKLGLLIAENTTLREEIKNINKVTSRSLLGPFS